MKTDKLYLELQKAIENAPIIPPCQVTDPELWFGTEEDAKATRFRMAKNLCSRCPVIKECATFAIANQEMFGVWGGLDPRERQALRNRHKRGRPRINVKPFD